MGDFQLIRHLLKITKNTLSKKKKLTQRSVVIYILTNSEKRTLRKKDFAKK